MKPLETTRPHTSRIRQHPQGRQKNDRKDVYIMTKKDMIQKVQEVKESYKNTLSLLISAKMRYREQNTTDIERLIKEVHADYNEVLRLEKEYFKPRNLKADMEYAIEDIETMDNHHWDCIRPTVRRYIERLQEAEQSKLNFDEMEEKCQDEVVPVLEKNGAIIDEVYVFGGDRVAVDFEIDGVEKELTYFPATGEISTNMFGKLVSLTIAELSEKLKSADDTEQQEEQPQKIDESCMNDKSSITVGIANKENNSDIDISYGNYTSRVPTGRTNT